MNIFSLLIANYNGLLYLNELVQSINNQLFHDFEIVFCDDASTDDSYKFVEDWAKEEPRLRIFKNEINKGSAFTKRKCVDLAQGEICGFLDSDDLLAPDAISIMITKHKEYKDHSLIYSNFYLLEKDLSTCKKYIYPTTIPSEFKLITGLVPNHFSTFKRKYYLQTSGIDETVMPAEDRDLVLKLEEVGSTLHIEEYLYYYRLNPNSISSNENQYKAQYWAWVCRYNACERRGLSKVETYERVQKYIANIKSCWFDAKNTIDYKIGNTVLKPFRWIKHSVLRWNG